MEFSKQHIQRVEGIFSQTEQKNQEGDDRITVHAAIGRFAFVYEKIRNAVDYKDEHLIRKAAINRILKRLTMLENDPRVIAEQLIREMIGARYLPNNAIPISCIDDISWLVYKFQLIQNIKAGSDKHVDWLRSLVAVEIEEHLVDSMREKALISFLFDRINPVIRVSGAEMDPAILHLQIYLACYRTLVKADEEILGYKLMRAFLPEWMSPQTWMDEPRPIAERLVAVERRIKLQLQHPMALRFQRIIKPWAVALNMMSEALLKKPEETHKLLNDPEGMKFAVKKVAEERYGKTRARVRRATVRAMIYLLLTKMILALILEGPIEWYLYQHIYVEPLLVNLLFPPVLMFIVGLFIRLPGLENTVKIQSALVELLSDAPIALRAVAAPQKRSVAARVLLTLTYFFTFVITFGAIWMFLNAMSFTWISILIFIFFLCLVSFFAFRIRIGAREDIVLADKVNLITTIIDFFSIPILRAGRWLSLSISRINIFLFFFDFIFEAPYKLFLQLLEEWFAFAKEKKDELQP